MGAYYYAAGQRIDLEPDDEHVAVDQAAAREAGLDAKVSAASSAAVHVGAGVLVTPRSAFAATLLEQLRKAGALQPVYRRDKAMVVAMPEVRVELDSADERGRVMSLLSPNAAAVSITEESGDRLVLRPASGHGEDALKLANRIEEHAKPAAVSVRFVQFVPRPKGTR